MFLTFTGRVLAFFVVFCHIKDLSAFYPRVYKDTIITRGIFSVKYNIDWFGCIEVCMKTRGCLSYNFDLLGAQNYSCELSKCGGTCSEDSSKKVLRFSQGFVYQQLREKTENLEICDDVIGKPVTSPTPLKYKDCSDAMKSGMDSDDLQNIDPDGKGRFSVRCDQTTDGGGWVVIQRRFNGGQSFYLDWKDYCNGFGSFNGEFWLGLDRIQRLTASGNNILKIALINTKGEKAYALYKNFSLMTKEMKFRLNASFVNGSAGDSLKRHSGHPFSTKDQDNDLCLTCSCAKRFQSAWWYDGLNESCLTSDLNGQYKTGLSWTTWFFKIKDAAMMIRPANI